MSISKFFKERISENKADSNTITNFQIIQMESNFDCKFGQISAKQPLKEHHYSPD